MDVVAGEEDMDGVVVVEDGVAGMDVVGVAVAKIIS